MRIESVQGKLRYYKATIVIAARVGPQEWRDRRASGKLGMINHMIDYLFSLPDLKGQGHCCRGNQ